MLLTARRAFFEISLLRPVEFRQIEMVVAVATSFIHEGHPASERGRLGEAVLHQIQMIDAR